MVLRRSARRQRQLCPCHGGAPLNVELLTQGAGRYQLYLVSICRTERSPWLRHRRSPGRHARPSSVGSLRRPGELPSGLAGPGLLIGLVGALEPPTGGRFSRPSASSVGSIWASARSGRSAARAALVGADGAQDAVEPRTCEEGKMAGFMQIIEMQTSRIDEVKALIR